MRILLSIASIALLALVASAAPAAAQAPDFSQAYQLRAAMGNIPTTNATEPDNAWNIEQRLTVQFTNATESRHGFQVPAGASVLNATCTCNPSQATVSNDAVVFTLPTSLPSGTYVLTVTTTQRVDRSFGFSVNAADAVPQADRVAIVYLPAGAEYDAQQEPDSRLPGVTTSATILQFNAPHSPFWFSVHPASAVGATGDDDDAAWTEWLVPAAIGLLLGIVLWAALVSKGMVQAKSRKQVVATAAHVEAAAEPAPVLEGRKRALLAALKEIEVAKQNNEMPPEVYDAVKADLKKQAVTVMRALEASQAASDAKA